MSQTVNLQLTITGKKISSQRENSQEGSKCKDKTRTHIGWVKQVKYIINEDSTIFKRSVINLPRLLLRTYRLIKKILY